MRCGIDHGAGPHRAYRLPLRHVPALGRRPADDGPLRRRPADRRARAVSVYKSSDWAERAFCGHCGTHLYYRLVPADEYVVPAGLLQQKPALRFVEQIYVDAKPPYYRFADQTRELTEAEVLAKYGVN